MAAADGVALLESARYGWRLVRFATVSRSPMRTLFPALGLMIFKQLSALAALERAEGRKA